MSDTINVMIDTANVIDDTPKQTDIKVIKRNGKAVGHHNSNHANISVPSHSIHQ